jgi:hypothetical protein
LSYFNADKNIKKRDRELLREINFPYSVKGAEEGQGRRLLKERLDSIKKPFFLARPKTCQKKLVKWWQIRTRS